MNNQLLSHLLKTNEFTSKLELIESWTKLSIENQQGILEENHPIKLDWNEGYLACLEYLKEVINHG